MVSPPGSTRTASSAPAPSHKESRSRLCCSCVRQTITATTLPRASPLVPFVAPHSLYTGPARHGRADLSLSLLAGVPVGPSLPGPRPAAGQLPSLKRLHRPRRRRALFFQLEGSSRGAYASAHSPGRAHTCTLALTPPLAVDRPARITEKGRARARPQIHPQNIRPVVASSLSPHLRLIPRRWSWVAASAGLPPILELPLEHQTLHTLPRSVPLVLPSAPVSLTSWQTPIPDPNSALLDPSRVPT